MMKHAMVYAQDGVEVAELRRADVQAKVAVSVGNTLFSLQTGERELLYFPYSLEEYAGNTNLAGNPFLHPWANRLEGEHLKIGSTIHPIPARYRDLIYRDNHGQPLHGLLLKTDGWKTIDFGTTDQYAYHAAELIFDAPDWLAVFPWLHVLRMKHELFDDHLQITLSLQNADEKSLPLSFGFHPYFRIDPQQRATMQLHIPARELIETNERMIPTGRAEAKEAVFPFKGDSLLLDGHALDHGFQHLKRGDDGNVVFALDGLELCFDEQYAFAQVYAPFHPDKPYVCIEPMTAATNALNRQACRTLAPGQTFRASFGIRFPA